MFLLKRVRKPINQSYCRFYASLLNQKRPKSFQDPNDPSEELLNKYSEKLLYNSILNPKIRIGFRKTMQIISKQAKEEKELKMAVRTVQPLPLALKYCSTEQIDVKTNRCENEEIESKEENLPANFPYGSNEKVDEVVYKQRQHSEVDSIKEEMRARKEMMDGFEDNWMSHYENYEEDLEAKEETGFNSMDSDWKCRDGTPDPAIPISTTPCGGCGAYLHCQDRSIPGYIPSEIFKNTWRPGGGNLPSIVCQRCHFLKQYNIALQVRVAPEDYPKILQTISFQSGFVVLLVDLTDFPCSIWPGIADIIGHRTPILVVGNKVDLLPRDDANFLKRIRQVLFDNLKLSGFGGANIKHIELVSAKTGYGVEKFISNLQLAWKRRGDLYLVGCTNVGKSSLFNVLLQSDFCKIQAVDLIQRATTSPWPGTTLNLLKFPVTKLSGYRSYARLKRLEKLAQLEKEELLANQKALSFCNTTDNATLKGQIWRTFDHQRSLTEENDDFSVRGSSKMLGQTVMGINENHKDYAFGKWCYDTPGVVHPDQILHLLTTEELVKTLPKQIIRPETYCLRPGMSLFIAGLARLDYLDGKSSVKLTVFRAETLPITICSTDEADELYEELLGTDLFAVPILTGDRRLKWPGLEAAKIFKINGKGDEESTYDIVLSSAGWIAITCELSLHEFRAWTPEKRGIHLRDCLLPKTVTLRGPRIKNTVVYGKHKFI